MPERDRTILPTLFGGAIIVAALYYGQELTVPLVLAALLAFVLAPLCGLLQRLWLPRALAVLVAVLVAFSVLGALGLVVGRQAATLATSLPAYQTTISGKWDALVAKVGAVEHLTKDLGGANKGGKQAEPSKAAKPEKPAAIFGLPGDISGLTLFRSVALPILGPVGSPGTELEFAL